MRDGSNDQREIQLTQILLLRMAGEIERDCSASASAFVKKTAQEKVIRMATLLDPE